MQKFRNILGKVPTGVLTGVTLALILWLTLAPHPTGDMEIPLFPGADKLVHMIMFGFLTFIALLETMKQRKWTILPLATIGVISIIVALMGIGIEILQRVMGLGRSFEILDILADTAGAIGTGGIWAICQQAIAKPNDSE